MTVWNVAVVRAAVELLRALAPVLSGRGRWYLFGAQAVTVFGAPRLSADVDVTLRLEPDVPEDLVIAKLLAGRPKDVEDVRGVLEVQGAGLDVDRVDRILGLLEEALGQSDLLPAWRALRRR